MAERDWDGFDRDELIEEIEDREARIEDLEGSLEEWRSDFNELAARLRASTHEGSAASVSTRTAERGSSYHDETEALREALEEGERELRVRLSDDRWVRMLLTDGPSAPQRAIDAIFGPIRRALSQHVGGEG